MRCLCLSYKQTQPESLPVLRVETILYWELKLCCSVGRQILVHFLFHFLPFCKLPCLQFGVNLQSGLIYLVFPPDFFNVKTTLCLKLLSSYLQFIPIFLFAQFYVISEVFKRMMFDIFQMFTRSSFKYFHCFVKFS